MSVVFFQLLLLFYVYLLLLVSFSSISDTDPICYPSFFVIVCFLLFLCIYNRIYYILVSSTFFPLSHTLFSLCQLLVTSNVPPIMCLF